VLVLSIQRWQIALVVYDGQAVQLRSVPLAQHVQADSSRGIDDGRAAKTAISDIAHELRTPLANIRAWLEAARDGLADNDSALARSLLEEAMLLQRTVDDLQLLALADAGQLKLHLQEVPLARCASRHAPPSRDLPKRPGSPSA
jgi:signal transduction histidine kinase